ncbi:MAG: hypothetical protein H7336_08050 [Bacteriovorax sp.]|nr:hypothetical protein [Bacteriovorax sp.]
MNLHPYHGKTIYFGTKHEKDRSLKEQFSAIGLNCEVVEIDTDSLGTFSGEVKRIGSVQETLRMKIKLVMDKMPSEDLFLASEGSFGPHPTLFFANSNQETLMFFDKTSNLEIVSSDITLETNLNEKTIKKNECYQKFLNEIKFPSHGLILQSDSLLIKGIDNPDYLKSTIEKIFKSADIESIKIFTDMRANFNPTRMKFIGSVGKILINKILTLCPGCSSPGFGIVKHLPGLPCRDCGFATNGILFYVLQCPKCGLQEKQKRSDDVFYSEPAECDMCNP